MAEGSKQSALGFREAPKFHVCTAEAWKAVCPSTPLPGVHRRITWHGPQSCAQLMHQATTLGQCMMGTKSRVVTALLPIAQRSYYGQGH